MRSFLGNEQRKELESDKQYFKKQLDNPLVQDIPMVRRNLARVEKDIETQTAPELKGPELDKVVRREKELREEIVPNMQSQAEMRQAPAGSVGREMAFQKRYKAGIIEWKNCMRTIHRDSDDPDVSNLERFRPVVSRHNLDNAFIPGKQLDFPSQQYQENYDGIDWSKHQRAEGEDKETMESRVRREKLAELREEFEAKIAALEAPEEEEANEPVVDMDGSPRLGLEES